MSEPSYQTARLREYSAGFRSVAERIFSLTREKVPDSQTVEWPGSFSILATTTQETAAKIIVYENGQGKMNGTWPRLDDGVYVLVRVNGQVGEHIWQNMSSNNSNPFYKLCRRMSQDLTLGIAPKHHERFAYFPVMAGESLQDIADLLHWCSKC